MQPVQVCTRRLARARTTKPLVTRWCGQAVREADRSSPRGVRRPELRNDNKPPPTPITTEAPGKLRIPKFPPKLEKPNLSVSQPNDEDSESKSKPKSPVKTKINNPKFPPKLETPRKSIALKENSLKKEISENISTKPPKIEENNIPEIDTERLNTETNQNIISQDTSDQSDEVTDAVIDEVDDEEDEEIVNPFNDVDGDYTDELTEQERNDLDEFNNAIQLELFRAKVDNDFPRQDFSEFVDVEAF